ncbi:hypothetical protein BDY24DRAFT_413647 [Mrakia frigida]|uniref:uncharacterized protein n=1 Tax=Mrakia frigida TaxID=29902 RepID=UPI003FCC1A79
MHNIKSSYQDAVDARYAINKLNYNNQRAKVLDEFDRIVMQARADIFGEETFFLVRHGLRTSKRLGTWLQDVFLVAIELKEELASAHRSLVLGNGQLYRQRFQVGLSTCAYENELPIQVRRHPSPSKNTAPKLWMRETIACRKTVDVAVLLAKTWRDLFLVALSVGNEAVALEAIKYVKEKEEFIMLIREEDEVGELNGEGQAYDDGWHSSEMMDALPRLKSLLNSKGRSIFSDE